MARAHQITDRAGQLFIDGAWVEADAARTADVVNPATEQPIAKVALGTAADVDRAVAAARAAFPAFAATPIAERRALLARKIEDMPMPESYPPCAIGASFCQPATPGGLA